METTVICFPSSSGFYQHSRNEAPVRRGLTFVPGDVQTHIRGITPRHSLLPTSQTRTTIGEPHSSLSRQTPGVVRGFHVPLEKYDGLDACYRPGSVWTTRTQALSVLPASNTVLDKRDNHLRLSQFTVFITDSDIFTLPSI